MQRALELFNRWFASAGGVVQTVLLVLVIVIWERLFPHADQHGFWLLYWLTVYSAITQPALAYIARQSGKEQQKMLEHLEKIVEHIDIMQKPIEPEKKDDSDGR